MPNLSQGILDDFLPFHPLEQSKKLPWRGDATRFLILMSTSFNRPNISQGQMKDIPPDLLWSHEEDPQQEQPNTIGLEGKAALIGLI